VYFSSRLDVGAERIGMEEQDQAGALVELIRDRPVPDELPSLLHELGRKGGLIARRGSWHGTPPTVGRNFLPLASLSSVPNTLRQPYS